MDAMYEKLGFEDFGVNDNLRKVAGFRSNFTMVYNDIFHCEGLDTGCIGLYSLILSLPPKWHFTISGLAKTGHGGRDMLSRQANELERWGFLIRAQKRDGSGRYSNDTYWVVLNDPEKEYAMAFNTLQECGYRPINFYAATPDGRPLMPGNQRGNAPSAPTPTPSRPKVQKSTKPQVTPDDGKTVNGADLGKCAKPQVTPDSGKSVTGETEFSTKPVKTPGHARNRIFRHREIPQDIKLEGERYKGWTVQSPEGTGLDCPSLDDNAQARAREARETSREARSGQDEIRDCGKGKGEIRGSLPADTAPIPEHFKRLLDMSPKKDRPDAGFERYRALRGQGVSAAAIELAFEAYLWRQREKGTELRYIAALDTFLDPAHQGGISDWLAVAERMLGSRSANAGEAMQRVAASNPERGKAIMGYQGAMARRALALLKGGAEGLKETFSGLEDTVSAAIAAWKAESFALIAQNPVAVC